MNPVQVYLVMVPDAGHLETEETPRSAGIGQEFAVVDRPGKGGPAGKVFKDGRP